MAKIMKSDTYSVVRLSKSMDLVSTSPLLRRYSRMMPGGWYLRRNLLSFISRRFTISNYSFVLIE